MTTKTSRVLLDSGARTANASCVVQDDKLYRALRLYLSVTVASGSGGLRPAIRGYDPVSGAAVELSDGGAPVSQTGVYVYEMQPGPGPDPSGAVMERVNNILPVRWDVVVKHDDASSYTYSLSCEVFQ